MWSEWSEWSDCSKTCGGGTQTSNRTITQFAEHGGKECRGEASKNKSCNRNICPGKLITSPIEWNRMIGDEPLNLYLYLIVSLESHSIDCKYFSRL